MSTYTKNFESLLEKKTKIIPLLLFLFAIVFLSSFVISTPTNGDTYAYAYSVKYLNGSKIHPGYYFLGHIFYFLTRLFSLSPLFTLNLISIVSGALSVFAIYLFIYKISQNLLISTISSVVLLFSGGFWFYSIYGEVYIPQLCFVLFSILFTYYRKPFLGSLFLLVAISITPTSVLVLPALLFIMYRNKSDKKQFFYFIIPLIVPVLAVFVMKFSKIGDIVELAVYSPRIFFRNFSLVSLLKKIIVDLVYVYGKSFGILNMVAILGLVFLYRYHRNLFWIMFLLIVPFTLYIFNLGLLTEDHLIITFVPMSLLIACGLWWIFASAKTAKVVGMIVVLVLLASQFWLSFEIYIFPEMKRSQILEKTVDNFAKDFEPNAILISDWNFGMPFWYFTQNETDYSLLTGRPVRFFQSAGLTVKQIILRLNYSFWIDIPNLPILLANKELKSITFMNGRKVYFVEGKSQSNWLKDLLLTKGSIRYTQIPGVRKVKIVELMEKDFELPLQIIDSLDFPMEKIYKFKVMPAGM